MVVCKDDVLKMKGVMDGAVYQRYCCMNYVDVGDENMRVSRKRKMVIGAEVKE